MYIVPLYTTHSNICYSMLLRGPLFTGLFLLLFVACHTSSEPPISSDAEELPFQTLELTSLDDFKATEASNWQTVGSVYSDRQVPEDFQVTAGKGILANLPDKQNGANLFTTWEHGDLDLSLDFMLPAGSNSGIYLQGRYELQLIDSWGKDSVNSGSCGGIYERWRASEEQGYEGHAPRLNASRAPGLWQHLEIKFSAPRFDSQGRKTADARFIEVILNGTIIQQDVSVSGPTRGSAFDEEKPTGPLMIQGDHGPVAIQNVRYKTYQTIPITLHDLTYQVYEGTYENPAALDKAEPVQQGTTDSITFQFGRDYEKYALVFEGTLEVPVDGEYLFTLRSAGPSWFYLNGEEVTSNEEANYMEEPGHYQTSLKAGTYPFRLVYTKYTLKWVYGLSLTCEGTQVRQQALHAPSSVLEMERPAPIVVQPDDHPMIQRAFMYHRGEKKTHCVAVGLPTGMNYAINLQNAALLSAWGGGFVDVTDMWYQRGEPQTAAPLGNPLELSDKPAFAQLSSRSTPWPDSVAFDQPYLQAKGYSLNPQGDPVFHYQLDATRIDDFLHPASGSTERELVRDVQCTFSDTGGPAVYCLLAEGETIEELPDGSYAVDGKRYYLTVDKAEKRRIYQRTSQGKEQLLAAMVPEKGKAAFQYGIIW